MKFSMIMTLVFLFASQAFGYSSGFGKTYEDYDDIVDRLSESSKKPIYQSPRSFQRKSMKAHAGIGMSQSVLQSSSNNGANGLRHGGLLLSLGVDLLSRRWGLEGNFINYGLRENTETSFRLKEFSLKGIFRANLTSRWQIITGAGISSRFLEITKKDLGVQERHATPSLLVSLGVENFLSDVISIGADINYKSSLISNSIDRQSIDMALRIGTHF